VIVIKSIVIGRGENADLRVDDQYASPRHCRIDQHSDGLFSITDEGSMNGTYIRHAHHQHFFRVALGGTAYLRPGDVVRVGRTEIPWMKLGATA
jgi:pSer/pThr/pTyr-binding forkhead associated (FHA) protein